MKKNIFLLSSWYPSRLNNVSGIFVKEQFEELAYYSNNNFYVNYHGFEDTYLDIKKPFRSLKKLLNPKNYNNKIIVDISKQKNIYGEYNLFYIKNKCFTWTPRIFNGGFNFLLKNIENNLLYLINKKININYIHSHVCFNSGVISYNLSKKYNIPYFITEHIGPNRNYIFIKNNKLIDKMFVSYLNAKKVICVSRFLKGELDKYSVNNTIVIPNVFKKRKFKCYNDKKLPYKHTKYKFLMVCAPSKNKGIDIIINVIKNLLVHNRNFVFNIIGYSDDLPYFQSIVRKLHLESYIVFLGSMNKKDIIKYYVSSSFYVCASKYETFGVSILESISFGLPVIATDCGGPGDIITNLNGILVPNNSESMIFSTLLDVLNGKFSFDRDLIIDDYEQRFSSRLTCNKILRLYS